MPKKLDKRGKMRYALRHGEDVASLHRKHHPRSKSRLSRFRSDTKRFLRNWFFNVSIVQLWRSLMTTKRSVLGVVTASFLAVFIAALFAGCGGGGGSDPAPVTPPPGGGGTAKILSVGQVSIGGIMIGTTAPGDPVDVDGDVTVAYGPVGTSATGALTTTCGAQTLSGTVKTSVAGSVTFGHNAWLYGADCSATVTFAAADFVSATKTVTFRTKAAPPAGSVTLTATPDTIVVGGSTTLAWAPINAANCLASGGWTGSVSNTGGSQVVNPTTTTTYGIECWNSANVSTGVVSATVTVNPVPVVTHPAAVVVFGSNWVYRVDPTVPGGVVPIANRSGHDFYSYGFRATALPNCQIQVSGLDNYTFAPLQFFWDRKQEEITLDTTGTAPPRLVGNYIFAVLPDPAFPDTVINVVVGEERYYVLDTDHQSLWYRRGTGPAVLLGTFPLGIKAVIAYPACTVQ